MELKDFIEYSKSSVLPTIVIDKNCHVIFANQCAAESYPEICYDEGIELLIPSNIREGFILTLGLTGSHKFCGYGPFVKSSFVISTIDDEHFAINPSVQSGSDSPITQNGKEVLTNLDTLFRVELSSISMTLPRIANLLTENKVLKGFPMLDIVNQSTYRIVRNISNLIAYKECSEGYAEFNNTHFYIDDLAEEVVRIVNNYLKDINIKIKFRKQQDYINMTGDYSRIVIALIQLISNAIKFSGCEGEIEVMVGTRGKNIILTVADKGFGMPPAVLKSCRTAFYCYNHGGKAIDGTGLGLTIAEFIAGKHYGRIDISSAVGKGTTAKLILPMGDSAVIYMREPCTLKPDPVSIRIALADIIKMPLETTY